MRYVNPNDFMTKTPAKEICESYGRAFGRRDLFLREYYNTENEKYKRYMTRFGQKIFFYLSTFGQVPT